MQLAQLYSYSTIVRLCNRSVFISQIIAINNSKHSCANMLPLTIILILQLVSKGLHSQKTAMASVHDTYIYIIMIISYSFILFSTVGPKHNWFVPLRYFWQRVKIFTVRAGYCVFCEMNIQYILLKQLPSRRAAFQRLLFLTFSPCCAGNMWISLCES
ncbi:Hypothetical_protein [Hexamita inflata]|uniref:Hypothetical_protein n=1 Tax=Hexamita inflata TaxID=28002 RepID=A0AA86UG87_9EUKA|nr:Hypothetical protein HINF_LOCUS38356 [Hexamita inflata]